VWYSSHIISNVWFVTLYFYWKKVLPSLRNKFPQHPGPGFYVLIITSCKRFVMYYESTFLNQKLFLLFSNKDHHSHSIIVEISGSFIERLIQTENWQRRCQCRNIIMSKKVMTVQERFYISERSQNISICKQIISTFFYKTKTSSSLWSKMDNNSESEAEETSNTFC
jgi:hypothetical protein